MNYKVIISIFISLLFLGCEKTISKNYKKDNFDIENRYKNSGFALIYENDQKKIKKLEPRSLNIYHKSLKKRSIVKITNPKNGKYLIAEFKSNRIKFSNFYNSILSLRIAEELELDFNEPFIELISVPKDSTFVAKKAKMFDEEKSVAEKAPVDGIQINDLNKTELNDQIKKKKKNFSYFIKVADFYYKDSAQLMINRIKNETSIKEIKIIELSKTKFRVILGPFDDIKSIEESFNEIKLLEFENLEIIKNV